MNHHSMSLQKKSLLVTLLFATAFSGLLTGCNTANGFGKDVEKAGDKIQEKASR